jgi:hypothetical protein
MPCDGNCRPSSLSRTILLTAALATRRRSPRRESSLPWTVLFLLLVAAYVWLKWG